MTALLLPCIIVNATEEQKRGRTGNDAGQGIPLLHDKYIRYHLYFNTFFSPWVGNSLGALVPWEGLILCAGLVVAAEERRNK